MKNKRTAKKKKKTAKLRKILRGKKIKIKASQKKLSHKKKAVTRRRSALRGRLVRAPKIRRSAKRLKKIPLPKSLEPHMEFSADAFFKAKIKVIGVGGGGASIVSEIGRSLNKASFVVADTDTRIAKKRSGIKYFLFGSEMTHGLGTGMNPQLAYQAANQHKGKITEFSKGQNIIIFIACLGGGVGSAATQAFAEALEGFDGVTFGIFTLPFKFEGKAKYQIAMRSLAQLRKLLNVSITIPNENIFRVISEDTPITQAFSTVNKHLIESLESLIDLIYNPGIINIDFADLKAVLQGKGNLAFLNTAHASGKNRLAEIIGKTLHNPLYRANNFPVQRILFNIQGGGNLSMFEVDKISRAIADKHAGAKIIFGISKNSKYKNTIKATVLMTGPGRDLELAPKAKKPKVQKHKKDSSRKISRKKSEEEVIQAEPVPIQFDELPVLRTIPVNHLPAGLIKSSPDKKTIQRRSALEAKKKQELEEQKASRQEEEWEIPAFLRIKK